MNALNIYSALPVRTVSLGSQMVHEWKPLLKKVSQTVNENRIIELVTHYAALSEVGDLDIIEHH